MYENCSSNQRPGNVGNSLERDQESGQEGSVMSLSSRFELNPIISLSANERKLFHQSDTRKRWEFREAWPKVNQAWGCLLRHRYVIWYHRCIVVTSCDYYYAIAWRYSLYPLPTGPYKIIWEIRWHWDTHLRHQTDAFIHWREISSVRFWLL